MSQSKKQTKIKFQERFKSRDAEKKIIITKICCCEKVKSKKIIEWCTWINYLGFYRSHINEWDDYTQPKET